MLLIAGLTMGVAGCSDDDPDYDHVTPPVVEVASNTLTGVITSLNGEGISGAKVSLGEGNSATTDANGVYLFKDVKAGTYQLKAEAEGKLSHTGTLTVADVKKTQNLVWNAALASDVKKEVSVSADAPSEGKVETETLKGNEEAKVEVKAEIAAGAVDTDADVKVTAPFEVSGTAALTGIYKAYEDITGNSLSSLAKMVGAEELIVTGQLAEYIGSDEATALINELKGILDITETMSDADVKKEIKKLADQYNVQVTDGQIEQLLKLCRQLEKLGANQLKEKLVSITNTVEKAMTAKDKVAKTVTTITEKVTGFLGSVSKFFAGLFNK